MSRGVIYTATFLDFISGVHVVEVPQGYTRVQINQFTAGCERPETWLLAGKGPRNVDLTGGSLIIEQTFPLGKKVAREASHSSLLKVYCEGIDTQSNVVAATRVGDTVYLGMNGNPYKTTSRNLRFYVTNEVDALVNNTCVVLQYTFI